MRPTKPLYPPAWWNDLSPRPDACECLTPGDEIVLCFVGYDANGNPLFSLKRPRPKCDPRPDVCPPKRCFY
ncbi:MAG: hypothetical protein IKJ65_07625 [Clostridia bacterium]|nr:hypothetical protein [Clostridia bacterium]